MNAPRVIVEFNDYEGLLAGLRLRAAERKLALSADVNANVSGLPDKYIAKLIGSNPVRRLGMISLGAMCGVLAIKCLIVEDEKADARLAMLAKQYGKGVKTRNDNLVHAAAIDVRLTSRFLKKIGRKGGQKRWAKLTPKQRSKLARKLNRIRWKKPNVTELKNRSALATRQAISRQDQERPTRRRRCAGTGAAKGQAPRQ